MKKILFSLLAIVAVAAVAGVGSWATWSDSEVAEDNYIAAGSLDLLIDGENWDGSAYMEIGDVYPGYSESLAGEVKNAGTIDGALEMTISNLANLENVLIEPEDEDGDTTDPEGELCDNLVVSVPAIGYVSGPIVEGTFPLGILHAGEIFPYGIVVTVDPLADNTIMTDKCEFDVELVLSQMP